MKDNFCLALFGCFTGFGFSNEFFACQMLKFKASSVYSPRHNVGIIPKIQDRGSYIPGSQCVGWRRMAWNAVGGRSATVTRVEDFMVAARPTPSPSTSTMQLVVTTCHNSIIVNIAFIRVIM